MATTDPSDAAAPKVVDRHALAVRLTHWVNALAVVILLGSGFNIFNAHPSLYWGQAGSDQQTDGRWLQMGARGDHGFVRLGDAEITTTGVFGLSRNAAGALQPLGYPGWATIPSNRNLAAARTIHFFFAWVLIINGLAYLAWSLVSGHLRRDLLPTGAELAPAAIGHDIVLHARLDFPKGEDARRYHVLQKLAYGGVVLVLIPLVIFTGLTMSPGNDAAWPWLIELFGGRASARSLHWIAASLILAFVGVHLLMVVLSGPINQVRAMITGRLRIDPVPAP
jgi:thiosulfate reductase cytochrome b subunit